MKAVQLRCSIDISLNPLSIEEIPVPIPGTQQVRVRVAACGVCRTDLHIIEGDLAPAKRPVIPGHEIVGVVDAVGGGVRSLKVGDRVGIAWLQGTCGVCEFCRSGRENLCPASVYTGHTVDGGYAEFAVAPEAFCYPIPAAFGDEEAAPLLCAGIIGYRALRLSGIRPGQRLGLYGFGGSAHIAIQVAVHRGCEVFVCSGREDHRTFARKLGAAWAGSAAEGPPKPLDAAILFAPAGELVPPALRALERGGTLAIAGIHLSPIPPLDYARDLFQERTLRSVTAATRQDALDLLREAAAIPVRTKTRPFALKDANKALQALKGGRIDGAAVLVP